MRRLISFFLFVALLLPTDGARAVQPDEILKNPVLESRARDLSRQLRCMVCQNQSIDDSDAPLARDLRLLVRERLTAGDSDAQVLDFLVARYGQFVLLSPRFSASTVLLWAAPFIVLLVGGLLAFIALRGRRAVVPDRGLTPEEERRLEQLIGETSDPAKMNKL